MSSIVRTMGSTAVSRRAAFLFVVISALATERCPAAIIITAPTINLPYSAAVRMGTFEVYVHSTEATPPQVGAMNVELQSPIGSALTFLLPADPTPTTHPYLFLPQAPTAAIADAGHTVEGTDFAFAPLPSLADGAGLLLVKYQIAAGVTGSIPLTFAAYSQINPVGTALFDANNVPLTASLSNGSINVASPIPEPATWLLALVAAAVLINYARTTRIDRRRA
jgi:hypothetical protein